LRKSDGRQPTNDRRKTDRGWTTGGGSALSPVSGHPSTLKPRATVAQNPPRPFLSDGCSGFMSFLWRMFLHRPPPWEGSCIEHDLAYWRGGPKELRLSADSKVMQDVAAGGHPYWAVVLFIAVRIGGPPWLPFPSMRQVNGKWRLEWNGVRWGYGWPWPKYKSDFLPSPPGRRAGDEGR
jgi:hypothetical protein